MAPAQVNQSIINGLNCLEFVVSANGPIGSREVARAVGLEHTRVSRILGTLCAEKMLEQTADRKYRPGPGVHVLSALSLRGSGMLAAALPYLRELQLPDMTVAMGVLWRGRVSYLVHATERMNVEEAIGAHRLYPAKASIIGHVLLSQLDRESIVRQLSESNWQPTDQQGDLLSPEFYRYLKRVRKQGYASLVRPDEELSLAVPIGTPVVAAIAVTGYVSPKREADILSLMRETAEKINHALNVLHADRS